MASRLTLLNRRITECRLCPRLVKHREHIAREKRRAYRDQTYWGRGVPGFGRSDAGLVIVGLAPGAHGSNRTGRMFTGDSAGDFLFAALHRAGLASQPGSTDRRDGLELRRCYITAAVRCAPPSNRPSPRERAACRVYLTEELKLLRRATVLLCLGQIAFEETAKTLGSRLGKFAHAARFEHGGRHILCSYHVSRQNTQTRRLTRGMFDEILDTAKRLARLDISGQKLDDTRRGV